MRTLGFCLCSQPVLLTSSSDDVFHVSMYTLPEFLDGQRGAVRDGENVIVNVGTAAGNVGTPQALTKEISAFLYFSFYFHKRSLAVDIVLFLLTLISIN